MTRRPVGTITPDIQTWIESNKLNVATTPQQFVVGDRTVKAHTMRDAQTVVNIRNSIAVKVGKVAALFLLAFSSTAQNVEIVLRDAPYPLRLTLPETNCNYSIRVQAAGNLEFTAPHQGADSAFFRLQADRIVQVTNGSNSVNLPPTNAVKRPKRL